MQVDGAPAARGAPVGEAPARADVAAARAAALVVAERPKDRERAPPPPAAAAALSAQRVLLGSVLAEHLGPLVTRPTAVRASVVPWLLRLQDEGTGGLARTLGLLEAVLDEFELRALAQALFARLGVLSISATVTLEAAGAEPVVRLAAALLARPGLGGAARAWPQLLPHLERLLTVRRPPSHELKKMIPKARCLARL